MPLALFVTSWLPALASAERCTAATFSLHCESRCAGVNASALDPPQPPVEQVMPAVTSGGSSLRRWLRGGSPLVYGDTPQAGSPTTPSTPSDTNFTANTVYAPAHRSLSPTELMAFLGTPSSVEWVPMRQASLTCVDGRHANGGLYAYGGDLGEFALGLSVLEHVYSRALSQAETTHLLEGWLARVHAAGGRLGACIGAAAVAQLAASVGAPSLTTAEGYEAFISNPPEEARPLLMLRLVTPEFVGCDHLRWMLLYPSTYATRTALVEQLIRAYYTILWNPYHPHQAGIALRVPHGRRADRAVVHVRASHWCAAEQGLAPLMPSKTPGGSMLIVHTDAVSARRAELCRYLGETSSPVVDFGELSRRVSTLGDGQAALSEKALAGMLRAYALTIH